MIELKLLNEHHPLLNTKLSKNIFIEQDSTNITLLAAQMIAIMNKLGGIGLSANQVGLSYKMFVIKKVTGDVITVINPEIFSKSEETMTTEEGCLSFPFMRFSIERPKTIEVYYLTPEGEKVEETLHGIDAVCFQHEYDHLQGITLKDKVSSLKWNREKEKVEKAIKKFKRKFAA